MSADHLKDCTGEPKTALDRYRRIVSWLTEASRLCNKTADEVWDEDNDNPARSWEQLSNELLRALDRFYAEAFKLLSAEDQATVKAEFAAYTA
jgi:hypothetical protein